MPPGLIMLQLWRNQVGSVQQRWAGGKHWNALGRPEQMSLWGGVPTSCSLTLAAPAYCCCLQPLPLSHFGERNPPPQAPALHWSAFRLHSQTLAFTAGSFALLQVHQSLHGAHGVHPAAALSVVPGGQGTGPCLYPASGKKLQGMVVQVLNPIPSPPWGSLLLHPSKSSGCQYRSLHRGLGQWSTQGAGAHQRQGCAGGAGGPAGWAVSGRTAPEGPHAH